jgi:hypothetical protein
VVANVSLYRAVVYRARHDTHTTVGAFDAMVEQQKRLFRTAGSLSE